MCYTCFGINLLYSAQLYSAQGTRLEREDRVRAEQKAKVARERAEKKKQASKASKSKDSAKTKTPKQVKSSDSSLVDLTPLVPLQDEQVEPIDHVSQEDSATASSREASASESEHAIGPLADQVSDESEPELPAFLPDWILEDFDRSKKESQVGRRPKPKDKKEPEDKQPELKVRALRSASARSAATKVLSLPGYGEIHYYHGTASMTAFCHCHVGDCRKSRSTRAYAGSSGVAGPSGVRAGQGRPIGMLAAWLRCSKKHKSQESHSDRSVTNFLDHSERVTARQWLMTHAGAQDFVAASERPLNDTDVRDEPLFIS